MGSNKIIRRQIDIIKLIRDNPNANVKGLSNMLQISRATMKSDLQNMEQLMAEYNVRIELLPANGIRVWGRENLNYMLKDFQSMQEFSLEKQLQLCLLMNEDFYKLQDIADALFASKSLVEKVMSVVLKKYPEELESVRHYGIRNISSQVEKRNRFAEILSPYFKGIDFFAETEEFDTNHFPIMNRVCDEDIEAAVEGVSIAHNLSGFSLTDESVVILFLQLLYAKYVNRTFKAVRMGALLHDMLHDINNKEVYTDAARRVCQAAGLEGSDEIHYFTYLFLMLRKQSITETDAYINAMKDVVDEIFSKILNETGIDLFSDKTLYDGLAVHLYTTLVRKDKLTTNFAERSGHELRKQYPIGFELAVIAAKVIGRRFSYEPSDEEMMYMTLHFQSGLERMKRTGNQTKVLVVCHYGLAASNLIAARIEGTFPDVAVIGAMSMQRFMDMHGTQADLILSTENIKIPGTTPIIYVTPMLPAAELEQIRRFITTRCIKNMLMMYILNAQVIDIQANISREEVLRKAVSSLEDVGAVSTGYVNSVLDREKMSSTELGNMAIPHGNPDLVLESRLVIVRMKNGIKWPDTRVSYVFLFAVSRSDVERNVAIFANFYKKIVRSSVQSELDNMLECSETEFKHKLAHMLN